MKSINLGNSGLKASAVALGCMRIAELDTSELEQLIDASLEAGIDFLYCLSVKKLPAAPVCSRTASA